MPVQTDLSVAPYFDDYANEKNYYQVLFKPGVALQTRELNVLQSILQNQIEQFGDNVFSRGTIISGCNFHYHPQYPYVKIEDLQKDGLSALVGDYIGLYAQNQAGLTAYILNANSGYVSQSPDLNTLFVRYLNSGTSSNATAFSSGDVLTIYDANNSIFQVNVPVGGTAAGISNSDSVVFSSALEITSNSVAILPGQIIYDPVSGAESVVVATNTTAIANKLVVNVRPFANDLLNTAVSNNYLWSFNTGNSVYISNGSSNVGTATISSIIGFGASAIPVTDSTGKILDIIVLTQGDGYIVPPYVTVKASNSQASISSITGNTSALTAQNYKAQVTVANNVAAGTSSATGFGYAFSVSPGVIYQKGHFLYVDSQTIIVDKYSSYPDQVVVGFNTAEALINSNIDPNLLDNSTGTYNALAPGADRLQLTPTLEVISLSQAESNTAFFPITAFSNGQPYLQNQQTSFSSIADTLAKRTYEINGDFVVQPFNAATTATSLDSSTNSTSQSQTLKVYVDPGEAYISGYRVKTNTNYSLSVRQGTDVKVSNSVTVQTNYGNHLYVNEIGGVFNFSSLGTVQLFDTAYQFLTEPASYGSNSLHPTGNLLGTARVRSIVPVSGTPGTPSYQAELYLFDVNMLPGKNFRDVRSVYYEDGTHQGVADVILSPQSGYSSNVAVLQNGSSSRLLFPIGANSVLQTNNHFYYYSGIFDGSSNVQINTAAASVTLQLGSYEFPFTGTLSTNDLEHIGLVFHQSSAQLNVNVFTVTTTTTSNLVAVDTGSTSDIYSGMYLLMYTGGTNDVRRVTAVINSTAFQVDAAPNTAATNVGSVVYFPENVPVDVTNMTAIASNNVLTIQLYSGTGNNELVIGTANATIMTPVLATSAAVATKTPRRDTTVVINTSNSAGGTTGPWYLGHPDPFRLKAVYKDVSGNVIGANVNVTNASSIPSTWVNVTNDFYVDNGQTPDQYGLASLVKVPTSTLGISQGDALVVQFDHFTSNGSTFFTRSSYPVNDTLPYSVVTATNSQYISTLEIPEMYDSQGAYYDLIDYVDFRPSAANTAAITLGNVAISTVNPVNLDIAQTVVTSASLTSGSNTITSIAQGVAFITVGDAVIDPSGSNYIPVGTTVTSINSTSVTISSPATATVTANLVFSGAASVLSTNRYYTVPNDRGTFTSDLTYYLGRTDRVIVANTAQEVTDIEGKPAASNPVAPVQPANTLTVNLVSIPPYPSVPKVLDANYTAVIDTRVASLGIIGTRANNHQVKLLNDTSTGTSGQVKAYTMRDIAALDARITALENQASLSQLEQEVASAAIPSSISPTINRFKYGFFADSFANTLYSDIGNPAYAATIVNGVLTPKQTQNNILFEFNTADSTTAAAVKGNSVILPYQETVLISQLVSTNGAVYVPPPTYTGIMVSNPPVFTLDAQQQSNINYPLPPPTPGINNPAWYHNYPGVNNLVGDYGIWVGGADDVTTNTYETYIYFPVTGQYHFIMQTDDNGRLYTNDQLIATSPYGTQVDGYYSVSNPLGEYVKVTLVIQNTGGPAAIGVRIFKPDGSELWNTLEAVGTGSQSRVFG